MLNSSTPFSMPVVPADSNNNGLFGGDGWWAIIIFALIFGWGGFGGYGGGSGSSVRDAYILGSDTSMLSRQLSDGFNSIDNALDRQNAGICDLGYTALSLNNQTNMAIMQGNNAIQTQLADCCCKTQQNIKDTQYAIATTGAGITNAIKDCCCDTEKQFMQTRYDNAQANCATLQAISDSTKQIIDYMAAEKAQNLRDENFSLKLAASQSCQNQYLINQLRPAPVPAFAVPSPFYYGGNLGFNGTTIA